MNLRRFIREAISEETKSDLQRITEDENFQKWFQGSQLKNRDGSPKIFYHGSNTSFEKFDPSKIGTSTDAGWLGWGFYFYGDPREAMHYGNLRSFFLNVKELYVATDEENEELANLDSPEASKNFTQMVKDEGCDGVYYNGNLRQEIVVFDPDQIWEIPLDAYDLF